MAPNPRQPELADVTASDPRISEAAAVFLQELIQHLSGAFLEQLNRHDLPVSSLDYPELAKRAFSDVLARHYGLERAAESLLESALNVPSSPHTHDCDAGVEPVSWAEKLRDYLVNPLP